MKKIKQPRKLRLNLETVKILKPDDLERIVGGGEGGAPTIRDSGCPVCCF